MKKYTKKDFLEDVKKEAIAIKENATKEEIERLDISVFDPQYYQRCIYGQMTGDCTTERASDLIFSCCKRYFDFGSKFLVFDADSMEGINKHVNGETIEGVNNSFEFSKTRKVYDMKYLSSIEAYIMTPFAKNKKLISFLKGETNDLKL